MTEQEQNFLREVVDAQGGSARVIVHPYFASQQREAYSGYYQSEPELYDQAIVRIEQTLPKIIGARTPGKIKGFENDRGVLIIIMENYNQIPYSRAYLHTALEATPNQVVFVPTYINMGVPQSLSGAEAAEIFAKNKNDLPNEWKIAEWTNFLAYLEQLHITKVILSGMRLSIKFGKKAYTDPNDPNLFKQQDLDKLDLQKHFAECVGFSAKFLDDEQQLEISNFTQPFGRGDLKNLQKRATPGEQPLVKFKSAHS